MIRSLFASALAIFTLNSHASENAIIYIGDGLGLLEVKDKTTKVTANCTAPTFVLGFNFNEFVAIESRVGFAGGGESEQRSDLELESQPGASLRFGGELGAGSPMSEHVAYMSCINNGVAVTEKVLRTLNTVDSTSHGVPAGDAPMLGDDSPCNSIPAKAPPPKPIG